MDTRTSAESRAETWLPIFTDKENRVPNPNQSPNPIESFFFLQTPNLKTPSSNRYEEWPKGYVLVICRMVDLGHQQQPSAFFLLSSFAEG
ncbi:hypothetical protein AVEN_155266-1 [Araneus ventricosus]|uniref:Uncharacterized protein n=1 Tax=Araneus ventricosus TaxID=182803 RepID=A0A4Y2D6F6_ARAVE|nr:hypothetical protein AVEN_155266-1 [Araneus ventricosus]